MLEGRDQFHTQRVISRSMRLDECAQCVIVFIVYYCVIVVFVDFVYRREAPGRVGASQYEERGGALHNVTLACQLAHDAKLYYCCAMAQAPRILPLGAVDDFPLSTTIHNIKPKSNISNQSSQTQRNQSNK